MHVPQMSLLRTNTLTPPSARLAAMSVLDASTYLRQSRHEDATEHDCLLKTDTHMAFAPPLALQRYSHEHTHKRSSVASMAYMNTPGVVGSPLEYHHAAVAARQILSVVAHKYAMCYIQGDEDKLDLVIAR